MTLYWPIWVMYTVILVIAQPVMLWSNCYFAKFYDSYTYSDKLEDLINVLFLDGHVYFIALVALASGMALFHYMYNHKSANMIHALPVDRTQLFGTNVISGLLFLAIPQTISAILLVMVALCNGIMEVYYVAYWLLLAFGTDIVAMAVVTFCAMFTGHILALPAYAFIINCLSYWVYYLISITVATFGFGVNSLGTNVMKIVYLFSPTEAFVNNIGICQNFNEKGECTGALVFGEKVLAVYLVVAIVLYVVAYIIYQKRHVEQAGEFVTVNWVKPIFRFGVALTGGFFGGMLMREFFQSVGIGCSMSGFVVLMLVIGALAYFVADMLIHKSFHVFKKKNWVGCGVCSIVMLCVFFGLQGVAKSYEDYVPELSEIETARVSMGYEIELEGEETAAILALHEEILDYKEICITEEEKGNRNYEYISISYTLKNGDYVNRGYRMPAGYDEIDAILDKIAEMEMDVENYLKYAFVKEYEQIELFNGGWFQAPFVDEVYRDIEGNIIDYRVNTMNFTSEQAKELFEAVIADAKAGTLMKYNIQSQWIREGKQEQTWKSWDVSILIEFQAPNKNHESTLVIEEKSFTYPGVNMTYETVDTTNWYGVNLDFGPDCEHIMNKLIEFGCIESADDIWWGEMEEN